MYAMRRAHTRSGTSRVITASGEGSHGGASAVELFGAGAGAAGADLATGALCGASAFGALPAHPSATRHAIHEVNEREANETLRILLRYHARALRRRSAC